LGNPSELGTIMGPILSGGTVGAAAFRANFSLTN
jgi:hypothetical protein